MNVDDSRLKVVMAYASGVLPTLICAIALLQVFTHSFSKNYVLSELCILVTSCLNARYFYRRARNLEATFFATRVVPSDPDEKNTLIDAIALVFSALLLLLAICVPLIAKP